MGARKGPRGGQSKAAPSRGNKARAAESASTKTVSLHGRAVALRWRESRRARRLTLLVDPHSGMAQLVVPPRTPPERASRFLRENSDWLLARLADLPPRIAFADGAALTVLGRSLVLRHRPNLAAGVRIDRGTMFVGGRESEMARQVTDWLRDQATTAIAERANKIANQLGRRITRITVRDTRTRWGSCSPSANLSFSWRLVLAPLPVLDYVVAHEVAHLVKLHHGPGFWTLVERLCPLYQRWRDWLGDHGAQLLRYG
jgi:predicted metal-dependent hydrolase